LGDVLTLITALFAIIFIPYLIIRAWVFPHAQAIWAGIVRAFRYVSERTTPFVMSNKTTGEGEKNSGDLHSQQLKGSGNQPIAIGNNAVNREVTVNAGNVGVNSFALSIQEAEAIEFRAKAEAVAELLRDGLVTNQTKAIETVFHCSRTSSKRPDTPYQRAKHLVDELVSPRPVFYDDLRAKIEAEVLAEGKR
jgi:hypothetical protein